MPPTSKHIALRPACLKRALPRCIGRSRGGLTSKLHAVCDGRGRPVLLRLTAGQTSDYKGAAMMLEALPAAKTMLADRAYDARWFRQALAERGITPCIPPHARRKIQHSYDRTLYQQRHRIENMFARLKDWHASTPATTAAPTSSSQPSPSLQPSSSGSMSPDPSFAERLHECDVTDIFRLDRHELLPREYPAKSHQQ